MEASAKKRSITQGYYLPLKLVEDVENVAAKRRVKPSTIVREILEDVFPPTQEAVAKNKTRKSRKITASDGTTADHAVTYPTIQE